jgi:DNA-directed RNA polymerase beta' subunit
VEPSLGLNEVGLPRKLAYEMYKPFVVKELKEQGMKAAVALKEYKDESPLS